MILSSKVTADYKQVPVIDYLASRFTYRSPEEWLTLLQNGRVSHNQQPCHPDTLVTQGDLITCDMPDTPPPPVNLNYHILYEDEWLLAINKPPDLLVHDKRRFVQANLIYHLRYKHKPPYPEATLVNRLDKNTSGIIIVAQNGPSASVLQSLFREQLVEKTYLALVEGVPKPDSGVIDLPLGKLESLPGVYRYGVVSEGKTAVTHYRTLQTFNNQFTLLELSPKTGRTHQLRVHMQAIGHTIVGDKLYSLSDADFLTWVKSKPFSPDDLIERQALHCAQTSFVHPMTQRPLTLNAPLPPDFQTLIQSLT